MNGWTECAVFGRLKDVFPAPAFLLLPQVRNQTGYNRRVRTADALAVSVWPSRGMYFAGVEIKVSRSDFRKEYADPAKAQEIQRYCRYWYLATPAGLLGESELALLPETWGLIEVGDKKAAVVQKAPVLECQAPSVEFVCAVLRAVSEVTVPVAVVNERIERAVAAASSAEASRRNYAHEELVQRVSAFEEASGVKLGASWQNGQIGNAVRMVLDNGLLTVDRQIKDLRDRAKRIYEAAEAGMARAESV